MRVVGVKKKVTDQYDGLRTGYWCPQCGKGEELNYGNEWFCTDCDYFNNWGPFGSKMMTWREKLCQLISNYLPSKQ